MKTLNVKRKKKTNKNLVCVKTEVDINDSHLYIYDVNYYTIEDPTILVVEDENIPIKTSLEVEPILKKKIKIDLDASTGVIKVFGKYTEEERNEIINCLKDNYYLK